jgi:hypothetical protein
MEPMAQDAITGLFVGQGFDPAAGLPPGVVETVAESSGNGCILRMYGDYDSGS